MLFNKYQYNQDSVKRRGYSQTCIAYDEQGDRFFVKWILGIEKNSTKSKILSDKLRHLQKVTHPLLPTIMDYGFDEELSTYAVVYQFIDACSLEDSVGESDFNIMLIGLSDVADCLCKLHVSGSISHGDLTPANILIDNQQNFYLIDFGLSDITNTLSQEQNLQIFAREFAAPEKFSKSKKCFPYQSDIFSFGKIIEWLFNQYYRSLQDEQSGFLRERILAENPEARPSWKEVVSFMNRLRSNTNTKYIFTTFGSKLESSQLKSDVISDLNFCKPSFDISISQRELGKLHLWIYSKKYKVEALYVLDEKKLVILQALLAEGDKQSGKLNFFDFDISFDEFITESSDEISQYFERWLRNKERESKALRRNREATKEKLDFYKELIDKEIDVIRSHSLKLQYSKFEVKGNEIHFTLKENEKCTTRAGILKHIDDGNDVNADPIKYIVSSDGNVGKESVSFVGTPLELRPIGGHNKDEHRNCFIIKDAEHFAKSKTPFSGYIMEDSDIKIEEKRRQKDAIDKVLRNDVQNTDLIYFLFKPNELQGKYIDYEDTGLAIKQKNIDTYSYNQKKAIINALQRTPLSVIQGPPGTGKTTVITEIVFQILEQKPDAKILITSQTNNAVDQVLENLLKNDISILRLSGLSEPRIEAIKKHTIQRKMSGWKDLVRNKTMANFRANQLKYECRSDYEQLKNLHEDWLNTLSSLEDEGAINQRLVDSIRVIGATCNHIASKKYSKFNFEFDYIIMDESGKATIAESLVPIIMGNNLIFVGDHRQLRPMLTANREVEKWLREKYKKEAENLDGFDEYFNRPSLFEDVITEIDGDFKTQLTECRRSSKEQVQLTSKCFYEPEGDEEIEYVERLMEKEHNLSLSIEGSVFMIDIGSEYNSEKDGQSSFNEESIKVIVELLGQLDKYDIVKDYSIGVITGYTAQFRKLCSKIRGMGLNNIRNWRMPKDEDKFTVSVIDRFQGLERDIVIVDLVKSGANLDLGFLETPNRINVALSRQKRLLIIVGDYNGIINAQTKRSKGRKCALQNYLHKIQPKCVIKSENLKTLFK